MQDFLARGVFTDTASICPTEGCSKNAVSEAVHCLRHRLGNLQNLGTMPAYPLGRWFGPYIRENIVLDSSIVATLEYDRERPTADILNVQKIELHKNKCKSTSPAAPTCFASSEALAASFQTR
jgi:hypothetical protein